MTANAQLRPNILLQPPRIAFGANCAANLAEHLGEINAKSVFVVTSPSVCAHAKALAAQIEAKGIRVAISSDVPPEPTVSAFDKLRALARAEKPDSVVAIGGGSVLDVAKLVAALHDRAEPVSSFFGIGILKGRSTRLICLPTTAGTGSEVSPNALLLDESTQSKKAVISPSLVPDAAFVDPLLMLSMPKSITAATGIDALSHCVEAFANINAHAAVDPYALSGIKLISSHLERTIRDGNDVEARAAVALGSLHGGFCLGPVNTAAVHALAYPLGGEFHVGHGLSIALLFTQVSRFNLPAAPARYAEIARAMGVTSSGSDEQIGSLGIDRLEALIRACGLPRSLADCGIPQDAIPRMAKSALQVTRLLKNNPREITQADAEAIYRAAF